MTPGFGPRRSRIRFGSGWPSASANSITGGLRNSMTTSSDVVAMSLPARMLIGTLCQRQFSM